MNCFAGKVFHHECVLRQMAPSHSTDWTTSISCKSLSSMWKNIWRLFKLQATCALTHWRKAIRLSPLPLQGKWKEQAKEAPGCQTRKLNTSGRPLIIYKFLYFVWFMVSVSYFYLMSQQVLLGLSEDPSSDSFVVVWGPSGSLSEGVVFCRESHQPSEGPQTWATTNPLPTHNHHNGRHHLLNFAPCVVEDLEARIVSSTWHGICVPTLERNLMPVPSALTEPLRKLTLKAM